MNVKLLRDGRYQLPGGVTVSADTYFLNQDQLEAKPDDTDLFKQVAKEKRNANRSKYGNVVIECDGIKFASKKECDDYCMLKQLSLSGHISNLQIQVPFVLREGFRDRAGKKHRAIKYIADFVYYDNERCTNVARDSKGMMTSVFRMKEKMFLERYGDQYLFEVG